MARGSCQFVDERPIDTVGRLVEAHVFSSVHPAAGDIRPSGAAAPPRGPSLEGDAAPEWCCHPGARNGTGGRVTPHVESNKIL